MAEMKILEIMGPQGAALLFDEMDTVIEAGGHVYVQPSGEKSVCGKIGLGANPTNPSALLLAVTVFDKECGLMGENPFDEQRFYFDQYIITSARLLSVEVTPEVFERQWRLGDVTGAPCGAPDFTALIESMVKYFKFWTE